MGEFHNIQASHYGLLGVILHLKTWLFDLSTKLNKMAIWKFWSYDFGKKMGVGEDPVSFQSFWLLQKGTRNFNVEWALSQYSRTKQTNKKNMHPWSFFSQKKIQNSLFWQIGAWNLCGGVLWYGESDGVVFIQFLWLLRSDSPFL